MSAKPTWSPNGVVHERTRVTFWRGALYFFLGIMLLSILVDGGTLVLNSVIQQGERDKVASNPVNAKAAFVSFTNNGLSDAQILKYSFVVNGKTYIDENEAQYLINAASLSAGQSIDIQYDAKDPKQSCLCRP